MSNSLSLIVPSYNSGRYLNDLIGSIFGGETSLGKMEGQTLLPDEVVIADDCSTDNTEEVCFELSKLNRRIKYIKLSQNSGTAIACNVAIENSFGDFITRIDSDDMRESWSFEKMMEAQLQNLHSYIYDNVMIFVNGKRRGREWSMPEYDFDVLLDRNTNHSGIMFPKSAWTECGGYPKEFNNGRDDWSFNVALGVVGYCGVHISGAGYLYRREKQNRTLKNVSSEHQKNYRMKMENHFKEIYSGRFPMGCCGNRSKMKTSLTAPSMLMSKTLVGADGMTLIQYNGENFGTETYFGPVTGAVYQFSKRKNIRNVDNRDLTTSKRTGLLDLTDHGKPIFSMYKEPVQSIPPVASAPIQSDIKEVENPSEKEHEVSETEETTKTDIETGQVVGMTAKVISKLNSAGIKYWEHFVSEDSAFLSEITGKSIEDIDRMKKAVVQ